MRNQKGFSLLEVMIALVILSIGMLGAAGMATTSIRTNANANHLSEALNIGQAEMEKLRTVSWGTLANGTNNATSETGVLFTNSWTATATGNVKDVTLKTSWVDGMNHEIELRTKIAR